jgi:hypothetical protein
MQVRYIFSSHVEHNDENKILNGYHMSEINYFKVLLLCKMKWRMMLDGCWYYVTWLNTDVNIFNTKRINLNDS